MGVVIYFSNNKEFTLIVASQCHDEDYETDDKVKVLDIFIFRWFLHEIRDHTVVSMCEDC